MPKDDERDYQIRELQRQVKGLQRQTGILNARQDRADKQALKARALQEKVNIRIERDIRDLQIKSAVAKGVPQKEVAEIFEISAGRVSQIVKRAA